MHTPTGFIPKMDRGIVTVSLQLPQGASLQRTDEVVRRANKIVLETPGVAHTSTYTGRSGSTGSNSSNLGLINAVIDDPRERAAQGPDRRQDRRRHHRAAQRHRGIEDHGHHPAAGARHGRADWLLDAPAEPRQHDPGAVRKGGQRLHRRGQPGARHPQRVHHLLDRHAAALRRRRSRQGADAARAAGGDLRGAARLPRLGLRQRLQHVRAHLPRHGAGRCQLPHAARERRAHPRAQRVRANGAARQPRQFPQCRRPRSDATLQSVPDRRGERLDAGRRQHRSGPGADGAILPRPNCPRASPTNGPTCRTRRRRSAARATTSSRCR